MSCTELRIVVIVGSPRTRGNSSDVAALIEHRAAEWGDRHGATVRVDRIDSATPGVGGCTGCGSCSRTGSCVIDDPMQDLYDLIDHADALVWVTPIYFGSVPSQLKAVIDRFQVFWARRRNRELSEAPNPYHARRPGLLVAVRGGGDPFGSDAAVVPVRSASNLAEVTLAEPLVIEGPNERGDLATAVFAGERDTIVTAADALLSAAAAWCAAEPTAHDDRTSWSGFEGGDAA